MDSKSVHLQSQSVGIPPAVQRLQECANILLENPPVDKDTSTGVICLGNPIRILAENKRTNNDDATWKRADENQKADEPENMNWLFPACSLEDETSECIRVPDTSH